MNIYINTSSSSPTERRKCVYNKIKHVFPWKWYNNFSTKDA
jgi:hypothetical protein